MRGGCVGEVEDFGLRGGILGDVAGTECVVFEIGAKFCHRTEKDGVVEVEIGHSLWVGGKTVLVALDVGAPAAGGLVEIVKADVGRDGGMHAAYDAVEDTFLEAFVVELQLGRWGVLLNNSPEVVSCLEKIG